MKLIIHDLENGIKTEQSADVKIISACEMIQYCKGCFGCWVCTPGQCIVKDGFNRIGKELSQADEVIIISQCIYGSVSPEIKRIIDRGIGYAHPFLFSIKRKCIIKGDIKNNLN